jgi:DNA modification methylase
MDSESVDCCVTSPPYWGLRDYGVHGQIGLEASVSDYVEKLLGVFKEVKRVLRDDGTLWLNLGDSYAAASGNKRNQPQTNTTTVNGIRVRMPRGSTPSDHRSSFRRDKNNCIPVFEKNSGLKPKDLVGIPWRVAFALQADGWYLRSDIIWHKPNPMPESVTDRPTKSHEYIFLLAKSEKYFYDHNAVREPNKPASIKRMSRNWDGDTNRAYAGGKQNNLDKYFASGQAATNALRGRNRRTVWTVTTKGFKGAHFATFPTDLIEPCIKAGCPEGGRVLDPFFGAGTTGLVASRLNRKFTGIELNPAYAEMARVRIFGENHG